MTPLTGVWYEVSMHVHVKLCIYVCPCNLFERLPVKHQQKASLAGFAVYDG